MGSNNMASILLEQINRLLLILSAGQTSENGCETFIIGNIF